MSKNYLIIILFIFISIFFTLSFFSAKNESLTYDEVVHLQEGLNALKHHTFAIDTNNPPLIRELASLPIFFGYDNFTGSNSSIDKILPARLVVIFLSILLAASVFFAAKFYFGIKPAIFSLFLFIFEPNILGNNHYLTLDIGLTLFFFVSFVLLLKLLKKPILRNFLMFGIFLGLAMASKVSTISYFLIISPILIFVEFKRKSILWIWKRKYYIVVSLLLAAFVVWATYFFKFDVLVAKRDDSNRVSSRLLANAKTKNNKFLESAIYFVQNQKLPLGNYLAAIKNSAIRSKQNNEVYFMGKSYPNGKWYFILINFLLKTPIPVFIFFLLSLISYIKSKQKKNSYIFFLIPLISILFISSVSSMSPWVRYLLPAFPFLIITASTSIKMFNRVYLKIFFILLCLWYAYGTLSSFPHFISFANEIAGPKDKRYKLLIDSNIDWGQSLPDIKKYINDKKVSSILLSYFGRDNGDYYNLKSGKNYGSHKFNDICAFHNIKFAQGKGEKLTAISISNWYYCGYYKNKIFAKERVINVVGDSILIFK